MSTKSFDWSIFKRGVFMLNILGIVFNPESKKIIIGRRQDDPYWPELSWSFPGGRPGYEEDLEYYLQMEIKRKTNLDVNIKELIFSRTYPEDRRFLFIYYLCHPRNYQTGSEKAGEKFVEVKWIDPNKLTEYATTSIDPEVTGYLKGLIK